MAAGDIEFRVLGPLVVEVAGELPKLGGPKQRGVLAMLIAHHGRPLTTETIVQAVYGEDAPARRRRTVQTYVSMLRSIVGDVIVKRGSGWLLDVPRESVDAARFEDLYESSRAMEPEAAAGVLREALALWRGHPYADVESHGLLTAEVTRLGELRLSAQEARIEADLRAGRDADLVGEIEGLLVEHPYRERFRAQHMLALYRAGRQREALRSYQQMRDLLVDELGVDPTPELRDLEQRILEQDESLVLAPLRSISRRAVLVADPGDPLELARMSMGERDARLAESAAALHSAIAALDDTQVFVAGAASYVICDEPGAAAAAALSVSEAVDGFGMRMAIDWGDVEIADDAVSGPPVSRAAVLAGVAHVGQVVLSPDAQEAILGDGAATGLRFESLGAHDLPGIEGDVVVFQLLVGDPPRSFPPLRTDRIPLPLPDGGQRSVRGYELREEIGSGSVGVLYRAYQPAVGREVAIEVIGRAESSGAGFIRRFEADAQRLALLDHPNISSPLDYWRDTDGAYVVYRYHRGGPLGSGADATPQLVAQIGSALAYAHSYGVVHGSIRPDRVMLDESGNGYLFGFPVGGVAPASSQDHAAYLAPEVMAGEPPTEATDVYGLGVLAYEVESGVIDADRPLEPVRRAVARAVSDNPQDRQPSVAELVAALEPESGDSGAGRFTTTRNPFKGLAAFHESDADDFFGRGAVTRTLVDAIGASRFVGVVGPSGIGKSSVVRAGLIPALRRGAVAGSEGWVITDMLPGTRPFLELGRALERVAVEFPATARERFADQQVDALQDLERVLPDGAELLLVIDQFEELFTMADEATARAFLAMLEACVDNDRLRVVVTLRADFLDRPLLLSSFGELLGDNMVTVPAPGGRELGEAVVGPANGVGVQIDPALVERITADVLDQPGALPLLQHTLAELFDGRDSDLLTLNAYQSLGGVNGSLAGRAEATFNRLEPDQQAAMRQVFLRLVTIVDDAAPTRRRVRIADLTDIAQPATIDGFVRARLLVNDNDPDTRMPTAEVVHEALLTHWPRLAGWVDASREELALSRRLDEAIADWETNARDDAYLLSGGRLAQHQAWTTNTSIALTDPETRFLELSTEADHRARTRRRRLRTTVIAGFAAAAVVASVLAVFGFRKADEARARELAASSISVRNEDPELAMLLAIEAFDQAPPGAGVFPEGLISLREATTTNHLLDRIEGETLSFVTFTADGAGVLAVDTEKKSVTRWEIVDGRFAASPTWESPILADNDQPLDIQASPSGQLVVVFVFDLGADDGLDNRVLLLDPVDGGLAGELSLGRCERVATGRTSGFSSDGSVYWMLIEPMPCHEEQGWLSSVLFDTSSWTEIARFRNAVVSMSGDKQRVLIDRFDGPAELREYPSFDLIEEFDIEVGGRLGQTLPARVLMPDGRTILLEFERGIDLRPGFWDVEADQLLGFAEEWEGFVHGLAATPDDRVLTFGRQGASLYDPRTGQKLVDFHIEGVESASVSLDGRYLVVGITGDGVALLSVASVVGTSLDESEAGFIWFNPETLEDAALTSVVGYVGRTQNPNDHVKVAVLDPVTGNVTAVSRSVRPFSAQRPDGTFVLIGNNVEDPDDTSDDVYGPLLLWDPLSGTETVLRDCTVRIGEYYARTESGEFLPSPGHVCPDGQPFFGEDLALSPDGNHLAIFGIDPGQAPDDPREANPHTVIQIWDLQTGRPVRALSHEFADGSPDGRGLSPDPTYGNGWLLVYHASALATYEVVDVETGAIVNELIQDVPFHQTRVATPDLSRMFLTTVGGSVHEYDTMTWAVTRSWQAVDGFPRGMALSSDERRLAVSDVEGFISIWDLEPDIPALVDRIPVGAWASDMMFIDAERMGVAVTFPENLGRTEWRVYELNPETVVDRARASLVRSFTDAECRLYNIDPCPTLEEIQGR